MGDAGPYPENILSKYTFNTYQIIKPTFVSYSLFTLCLQFYEHLNTNSPTILLIDYDRK